MTTPLPAPEHPRQAAYRATRATHTAANQWQPPTLEDRAAWDAWLLANRVEYAANRSDLAGGEKGGGE